MTKIVVRYGEENEVLSNFFKNYIKRFFIFYFARQHVKLIVYLIICLAKKDLYILFYTIIIYYVFIFFFFIILFLITIIRFHGRPLINWVNLYLSTCHRYLKIILWRCGVHITVLRLYTRSCVWLVFS